MTQITDSKAAVIAFLLADADVITQVADRVYGDELTRDESGNILGKSVVVSPSGGSPPSYTQGTLPVEAQRLDLICYGETGFEAEAVRRAVFGALKDIDRTKIAGVLIHWANPAGGVATGRDPDTDWPFKWDSWQVLTDTRAAS